MCVMIKGFKGQPLSLSYSDIADTPPAVYLRRNWDTRCLSLCSFLLLPETKSVSNG